MANVAHSRLDTDAVPEAYGFELFRSGLGASHESYRCDGDDRPFKARLDAWLIDEMVITAGYQMASRIVRTQERARADGLDYLTFMFLAEGVVTGQAGAPISFGAGQVAILDLTQPIDVRTSDNRNIGIRLPRAFLPGPLQACPDLHGRQLFGVAARIVSDHFRGLVRHAPELLASDAPLAARATAALITTCLETSLEALPPLPPDEVPGCSIRQRVIAYVETNLNSADLGPDALCRTLGLSRSNLYRAFAEFGGIAAYIRDRRLDAIHDRLSDIAEQRTVSELAFAYGFVSNAHFSNSFRRRFGFTPSEVRLVQRGTAKVARRSASCATTDAYGAWLKGLKALT